jgi:hypothetical protein
MTSRKFAGIFPAACIFSIAIVFLSIPLIAFASSFPGSIIPFEVTPGNDIVIQKGGFLAMEEGLNLSVEFQRKLGAGFFGGEGFIMQRVSGNGIVFLEIDMNKLVSVENKGIHYVEAPKYPTIDVDVTFVCNKYAPIADAIKEVNSALIKKEAVVDTYEDESGKSITVRLTFMHEERTLTKDEVMEIVDKIIAILKSQGIEMKQ